MICHVDSLPSHEISSSSHNLYNNDDSSNENAEDKFNHPNFVLSELKGKHIEKLIIAHININRIQNKFEPLVSIVRNKMDILVIPETKIDDSYATNQFLIQGYVAPLRLDRNSRGGGILIYVREDIPCKELKCQKHSKDIECIYFEINLHNNKWLLMGGYNPHKDTISQFLDDVSKKLDIHIKNYENMILLGDFNSEMYENAMIEFL